MRSAKQQSHSTLCPSWTRWKRSLIRLGSTFDSLNRLPRQPRNRLKEAVSRVGERDHREICDALEQFIWRFAGRVARENPAGFKRLLDTARTTTPHVRIRRSLLIACRRLRRPDADHAVRWILDQPELLTQTKQGPSDWLFEREEDPARMALRSLGIRCSDDVLFELVEMIMSISSQSEVQATIWRNARKPGQVGPSNWFYSGVGSTQHRLLASLPIRRLAPRLRDQIGVWNRKFGQPGRAGVRQGARGGTFGSAIPQEAAHYFSDRQWRRLMRRTTELAEEPEGRDSRRFFQDHGESSSPEFVARTFEHNAMDDPRRFIRLAMTFPENLPEEIVRAVLRAAALGQPGDLTRHSHSVSDDHPWHAAPGSDVVALVRNVISRDLETYTRAGVCDVIERRRDIGWPADVVDWLKNEACNDHGDRPWSISMSEDEPTGHDVETTVINARQPRAISALTQLGNPEAIQDTARPALEQAILAASVHGTLAARTAALQGCTAWLNVDRDEA